MDRDHNAARPLLADSRLRVDLDDYRLDDREDIDWDRLRADRAYSTSEAAVIDLAEGLVDGALGRAGISLDSHNWAVFLTCLDILRDRPNQGAAV
jgi:hypothetical protein